MTARKLIRSAKTISSCGSTGVFVNGVLNENFDVTSLETITSLIDEPFEVQYINEDGSVSNSPEFGDGFDEWTINIK